MTDQSIYITDRVGWRKWLKMNYQKESIIWLIHYKKHTGQPSLNYNEAVEEALCWGWIDSLVRKIDDERYMQKYTPRNENSIWWTGCDSDAQIIAADETSIANR